MSHTFTNNVVIAGKLYVNCIQCGILHDNACVTHPCGNFGHNFINNIPGEHFMLECVSCGVKSNEVYAKLHCPNAVLYEPHHEHFLNVPRPARFYVFSVRLYNVDGTLSYLSECKGFRNYVKAIATEFGVTGNIQRYHNRDVLLNIEGTGTQMKEFFDCLNMMRERSMIEYFTYEHIPDKLFRVYDGFHILPNRCKMIQLDGHVQDGQFSEPC